MKDTHGASSGFTLVEVLVTSVLLLVVLGAFASMGSVANRTLNAGDRRAEACEKCLRFLQRITQFGRSGVLSTYRVEATADDIANGRATAVGEWVHPVDGEPRTVAQFRSADGILAMNAGSLTEPIELRFVPDPAEGPGVGIAGRDDDGDHLIDEGHVEITYNGVRTGLLTGIESLAFVLDRDLLTVQIRTARRTDSAVQFYFEHVLSLRNN
jgi:prepilin-type N-terminal cleavage/methylation domain-containing protein